MILQSLLQNLTLYIIIPLMTVTGLYLTIRLRFPQIAKMKLAFKYLFSKDSQSEGDISHFQALSAVLAGNLGTGNISGVAIALSLGGPGAIVWMWFMAFLGAVIKYAGCLLGVKYRIKNEAGEHVGGPMYYISKGLGLKKLSMFFAFFAIIASFTVGNLVQVNSLMLPLKSFGFSPALIGFSMLFLTYIVIIGGMQRLAKVVTMVVPAMTLVYLLGALAILFIYRHELIPAALIIVQSAFKPAALTGGALGYGMMKALSSGFERGIFATDAGTGIAPILQSSARTDSPIVEGVIAMIAPIIVMVVCTITALVLIVTGAWQVDGLQSTNMCTWAFHRGLNSFWAEYIVVIALFLFAFTTILAWSCCVEKAVGYLFGINKVRLFQYLFILMIPIGAFATVEVVWILADISIALMLLTNLVGIIGLSKEVVADSRTYFSKFETGI